MNWVTLGVEVILLLVVVYGHRRVVRRVRHYFIWVGMKMSELDDTIAALTAAQVASQQAQDAAFKRLADQIAAGNVTPAQVAAITAVSTALVAQKAEADAQAPPTP